MEEIHEGICGAHQGYKTIKRKAELQGYFWPDMEEDAKDLVRKCDKCQKHADKIHTPAAERKSINSPWPFSTWGMDILGPFPTATGQRRFLLVAVDHFTKWIEAEAVATITAARAEDFFFKEVITRFGLPHTLITDNGKQFDCQRFHDFCDRMEIEHKFGSVSYPQTNGMTEVTNRNLLTGLKKRLDEAKGNWVEELYPYYGPRELHQRRRQEKHHSVWHMEWKQWYLLKWESPLIEWSATTQEPMTSKS